MSRLPPLATLAFVLSSSLPLAGSELVALASEAPAGVVQVVMPASGLAIELPVGAAARWETEGTLVVGARDAKPIDRLLGMDEAGQRLVTIEIRREACGPAPTPGSTSPWPTLGYAGIRRPLPERRAVASCKAPDLALELRFPAGVDTDPDALLSEADRWEPVVAALHSGYGKTRVDLMGAIAQRAKLVFEAGADGPPELLAQLAAPFLLRSGLAFERLADQMPWLLRDLGGHDVLTLLAPSAAGLSLQLLPFGRRYDCEVAMAAALRSQLPAPPDTPVPPLPPGWKMARAVGTDGVAFCAHGGTGGLIAIGGARMPRAAWLPIARPILGRLGERLSSL